MESILIPTDFSPTARNAAFYALKLAKQIGVKKLVLYHSYEIPVTMDPLAPGIEMYDIDSLKEESELSIEKFKLELKAFAGNIKIDTVNEFGALTAGLDEVCEDVNAELIVMGITGGGFIEEKLIGSGAVSVSKHTSTPVIIVPATTPFLKIEKIVLLCDFDKADKTIPVEQVKQIVSETNAKLYVLNVEENADENDINFPSNEMGESYAVHTMLRELDPEYHFSRNRNYIDAINDFALENMIDLIITVPKQHNFFEGLFTSGHTKSLAFHSNVPLMVVHKGAIR